MSSQTFRSAINMRVALIRLSPLPVYFLMVVSFPCFTCFLPMLVPGIFSVFALIRARYTITNDGYLLIFLGIARKKISISSIQSVTQVNVKPSFGQFLYSYGNGENGFVIKYNNDKLLVITPEESELFLHAINEAYALQAAERV